MGIKKNNIPVSFPTNMARMEITPTTHIKLKILERVVFPNKEKIYAIIETGTKLKVI
jgi:hypothetical protein